MKNYTYHFEVESMVAQFIAALDDIVIKRYNKDRVAQEALMVRFVYAPKARVLQDLTDKAQNLQLPVVAVSIGSVARDTTRVYNKLDGSNFNLNPSIQTHTGYMPQPLPVDVTVNVDIVTKYQKDMDQIITNFIPYCDPYFVISWRLEEMNNHEIRSIVLWSGNMAVTYPQDLNATTNARVLGSTTFTIKGWLFKPIAKVPVIFDITSNFLELSSLRQNYGMDKDSEDGLLLTGTVYGIPQPSVATPERVKLSEIANTPIMVYGQMFNKVKNIYLTGSSVATSSTFFNPFSSIPTLSATYTGFMGYKLNPASYKVINESSLTLNVTSNIQAGHFDIIVENIAGYRSLTSFVNRYNDNYVYDTSPPALTSGIKVL